MAPSSKSIDSPKIKEGKNQDKGKDKTQPSKSGEVIGKAIGAILTVKDSNETIRRKQIEQFSMTLDEVEELVTCLDVYKSENKELYKQMTEAKELHQQLESQYQQTENEYQEIVRSLTELEKRSSKSVREEKRIIEAESRYEELEKENKKLKKMLAKHQISTPKHGSCGNSSQESSCVESRTVHLYGYRGPEYVPSSKRTTSMDTSCSASKLAVPIQFSATHAPRRSYNIYTHNSYSSMRKSSTRSRKTTSKPRDDTFSVISAPNDHKCSGVMFRGGYSRQFRSGVTLPFISTQRS